MKFIDSSGVDFDCAVRLNGTVTATGAVDLSTATALTGIEVPLTLPEVSLFGSATYRITSPFAGTVVKVWSNLNGEALATGNATITASIGAVAITDGAITVTQAASAVGDVDSCTPSAANTVAAGSDLNFTVGGSNSNEGAYVNLTIVIRRSA